MKFFILILNFILLSSQLQAQQCSDVRECQLKNASLLEEIAYLKNENYKLFSELNQCKLASNNSGSGSSGKVDLILSLKGLSFTGWFESDSCGGACNETIITFNFFNNTLNATVDIIRSSRYYPRRTFPVAVPDQYGEYLTVYHPHFDPTDKKVCNYMVIKDKNGKISKLTLTEQLSYRGYTCPSKYILTVKKED